MNFKSKTSILIAVTTALITFACLGGAPSTGTPAATTEELQPTQPPVVKEGKLEIASTNSYIDSFNDFNVTGEIVNNTNKTIENVTLTLSITDTSGVSLLKDDDGNALEQVDVQPYIYTLAPGATAPFNYYISADEVEPANFEVTIKDYDKSSAPDPLPFDIQNVQTAATDNDVVLTGEVVNLSSEQMNVEALAGAVLDDTDTILAANTPLTYSRYLFPAGDPEGRDRGPFVIRLFGPIENVSQWKIYARPVENWTTPSVAVDLQLTSSYFDQYGTYHLLGTMTNNGSDQISPAVIGSLHNQDQTLLDVASMNLPFYLNIGESTAFDLYTFQVVDTLPEDNANSAEKVLNADLFWTFTTDYETVVLDKSTFKIKHDDYGWQAQGTITNTSGQTLSSINALIQCVDADNQPIATNYTYIYPATDAEYITPGDTSEFDIDLYPPAETTALKNCAMTFQGMKAQ